jgi:hypothetical protein
VASTNFRYSGGSSSVFSSALKRSLVSWCASSIMKTLKRPTLGLVGGALEQVADLVDAAVEAASSSM